MSVTPKRLAWLERLAIGPAPRPPRTKVGFDCHCAGWTEWNYVNSGGEQMTADEAKARYGEQYWNHVNIDGERLTPAGRELLEKIKETQRVSHHI